MAAAKSGSVGFRLELTAPSTVGVSGALSFATASAAFEALRKEFGGDRHQLDLSAVSSCDSAGLACVLAVLADASERGYQISVRNAPAGMLALAQVSDVEHWLQ